MRWINGLTWDEKDKRRKNRREQWHSWFAWFPVIVGLTNDGRKIKMWLTYIERKGEHIVSQAEDWWSWEYREIV